MLIARDDWSWVDSQELCYSICSICKKKAERLYRGFDYHQEGRRSNFIFLCIKCKKANALKVNEKAVQRQHKYAYSRVPNATEER